MTSCYFKIRMDLYSSIFVKTTTQKPVDLPLPYTHTASIPPKNKQTNQAGIGRLALETITAKLS